VAKRERRYQPVAKVRSEAKHFRLGCYRRDPGSSSKTEPAGLSAPRRQSAAAGGEAAGTSQDVGARVKVRFADFRHGLLASLALAGCVVAPALVALI